MQQGLTTPTQPYKPDYIYWIKHYSGVFWRWKFYIIPTFPILAAVWLLLVLTFGTIRPELESSVLLGTERPPASLVVADPSFNNLGKMKLLQSRNFLSEIVDSLSLNMIIPKFNRSAIFSLVKVDSTAIPGNYRFAIDELTKLTYTIEVSNKSLGIKKKVVTTGTLPSLDTIHLTGMTLAFTPLFLKKPKAFKFVVLPKEKAIEYLRNRVSIKGSSRRDPMMEGIVIVSLAGADPKLITTTVNLISTRFVEKNLSFRKRKTSEIVKALHTQLQIASAQLAQDENRVRIFKEENPKIGLGIDAQNAINTISMLESKDMTIANESTEANEILKRLTEQNGTDDDQTTSEALLFLSSRKIPSAIVMQQEFSNQLQQKASLIANRYSPEHPMIKEIQTKIDAIKNKLPLLLTDYINKQESEINQTKNQKMISLNQLKGLPQKEMQLAALTRQQQINSEIYSSILTKYNQAKLADETEVTDIYVMDYAVPPESSSTQMELLKLIAIGLIACILIALGPPVLIDFFDKRPRSEEDCKRFLAYPLLETVPIIIPKKEPAKPQEENELIKIVDPKLLTIGPYVTYLHELFRSLRAKVNYRLEIVNGKSFMITSYDSSEGKSLMAANIAIMAAQQHVPTLLIDGDLRRGLLHETFAVDNRFGLSDLLLSNNHVTEQMLRATIKPTTFSHLFLLTCGTTIENSTELLTRPRFRGIMQWIYSRFAMIIIDSPPLSPVTDPVILSSMVSGTLLVVRAGKTNTAGLNNIINEFPALKKTILGVVLNGVSTDVKKKQYNAYYYRNRDQKQDSQLLLTNKNTEEIVL